MGYNGNVELATVLHYETLSTWANYLLDNALFHPAPVSQIANESLVVTLGVSRVTSDWLVGDAAGAAGNTTNIALKGIITLRSMTEIQNSVIGKSNEASKYLNAANLVLEQSIQLSDYGSKFTCESSTAEQSNTKQYLLRALYADKILGSNFVPESVYERQRTRFTSDMSMERYGVPITDRNNFTTITHKHFTVTALSAGNSSFFGNLTFTTVKNYTRVLVNTSLTALAHTHDNETGVGV